MYKYTTVVPNFTENAHPKKTPVIKSHVHHFEENSSWFRFLNLAMANVAPEMKKSRIGSSNIYWLRVIMPTSESKYKWSKYKIIVEYLLLT